MIRILTAFFLLTAGACFLTAGPPTSVPEPNVAPVADFYIGSEACMSCHANYKSFTQTLHSNGLKHAPDDLYSMKPKAGVIVDADKNGVDDFRQGLDFNKVSSVWDPYKPNAPVLGYQAGKGYSVKIGLVSYPVGFVHGGSGIYKQRFVLSIPVTDRPDGLSAGYYYSPIQFNETTASYVLYEPQYWYNADRTPKFVGPVTAKVAATGKSFNKECVGCHSTALVVSQDANGEYLSKTFDSVYAQPADYSALDLNRDGNPDGYNIGCERCHGPGGRHVVANGHAPFIVNPGKNFTAMQQNESCGSCHSRGKSLPSAKYDYPYNELTGEDYPRHKGEPLYTKYWKDANGLWPDMKTSRQHHQQMQELKASSKWEYQFHKVICTECHDPHKAEQRAQIRTVMHVDGAGGAHLAIKTQVKDNSLCLACHAGFGPFAALKREDIVNIAANRQMIASVVQQHSHHPYDPEAILGLSRCTECHMAKMAASGAPYDMTSHTFEAVAPEKTIKYQAQGGMPNSCAVRCHRPSAPSFGLPADLNLTVWNEPADRALAEWLMKYYGPEGSWWKTAQ